MQKLVKNLKDSMQLYRVYRTIDSEYDERERGDEEQESEEKFACAPIRNCQEEKSLIKGTGFVHK